MKLFTTIWHTGTHYFKGVLEADGFFFQHVGPDALLKAPDAEVIYTTYRDPFNVAASWANRDRMRSDQFFTRWQRQWSSYKTLLDEYNPVVLDVTKGREQGGYTFGDMVLNSAGDRHGLHEAYANGDMDKFYTFVPRHWIEFVQDTMQQIYPA